MKRPWGKQSLPTPLPEVWGTRTTQHRAWKGVRVCVTSVGIQQSDKILFVYLDSVLAAEPMLGQGCGWRRAVGMAVWYSLCRRKQLFLSHWLRFPGSQSLSCSSRTIVICAVLGLLGSARGLRFPGWLEQAELRAHSGFLLQTRESCK